MIDRKTKLSVILNKARTVIQPGNFCKEMTGFEKLNSDDSSITIGDCLDGKATHLITDVFYSSLLLAIGDELDPALRTEFIKGIKDTMTAFQVYLRIKNPTAENICVWIWNKLKNKIIGLYEIRLWETANSFAVYNGE